MIDTHCHLWFPKYKDEVPAVLDRAKAAGIHTLICVGCNAESSRQSVEIAGQYENVYAAVGIHPTEVLSSKPVKNSFSRVNGDKLAQHFFTSLRDALKCLRREVARRAMSHCASPKNSQKGIFHCFSQKIVAIGETGIDYFHEPYDADLQKQFFREQCLIAQEFNLPVIVHLRSGKNAKPAGQEFTAAEKACLEVLDDVAAQSSGTSTGRLKVLFHCFSSDRKFAEEVLKRGWYLSFSGVITYPNAQELREVVKMCPLDRMVVETDSPFLAPQSHRGERNEPSFVVETARHIAELKGIPYEEVQLVTDQNTERLFLPFCHLDRLERGIGEGGVERSRSSEVP